MSADGTNVDASMNKEASKESTSESPGDQNDGVPGASSVVAESAADTDTADAQLDENVKSMDDNNNKASKGDDTASEAPSESKDADASSTKKEAELSTYSTRGRSSNDPDFDSRVAREALEEIGRKESSSTTSLGASFLESLSEEERRSRTRYLPEVDGMHSLRKLEIKEDLHLARALLASASSITGKKKKRGSRNDEGAMDVDGGGVLSPDEDISETPRSGHIVEMRSRDLIIPCQAFVAPPGVMVDEEGGTSPVPPKNGVQSPLEVDSVTAFNPPRPPESIGAKKKHRMLRWERRPEDVESDLNNYRKTVQRTRQELQNAETEYGRLQTVDAHLRWHFLNHLNLLNDEYVRLNGEMGLVQQECIKAADLVASRTRSRGAGKGSYVMRDVLNVLKQRQTENPDEMQTDINEAAVQSLLPAIVPGIGGVPFATLKDFKNDTTIEMNKPANAWIVAGDKVETPYGKGEVVAVRAASVDRTSGKASSKNSAGGEDPSNADSSKPGEKLEEYKPAAILPPVISVRLPFGTGHFTMSQIKVLESPASFTDKQLAKRWESMVETAMDVGGALDVGAMSSLDVVPAEEEIDEDAVMDVDRPAASNDEENNDALDDEDARFLPFGSGLMPTAYGRGVFLATMPLEELEKEIHHALHDGEGVLGRPTNPGVPDDIKEWEKQQQEFLTLKAESLHLRNNLFRQRRIRLLNTRTRDSAVDRYERAESLVAEMRVDLKSLIGRLDTDLKELGINEDMAEKILADFYRGEDEEEGEASPLKRQRRSTRTDEEIDGDVIAYREGASDRESFEDLSGDEMEAHRAKKIRPSQ
ncbi:unnamed protein product [Cylindrotheca closterium]|uniref:Uncharacterized protein n=1 Tax=Cylindrotheca closterium TaxID=2856 RepID=A0AAD2PXP0_9STRA|nr:unnamed protein product [Cylindrotheca closterium]